MFILIILFPLLSFIICILFGRKIGIKGVIYLSNILLLFSCFISYFIFNEIIINELIINLNLFYWFNLGLLNNNFGFLFDRISSTMLILIITISFFVHLYSSSYMSNDPHIIRFIGYLSLFTFFMIILVISNNIIQLFIGWEGVGLCSYLLINFWFTRIQANKASIKAMVINKIGDLSLILSIIFIWKNSGLILYNNIFSIYSVINLEYYLNFINILLLIGVIGKSAQIGLHMWLPDAMEGPTPVSALIHAATMVTAGVFLIIRTSPLFENTPLILIIIIFIGSFTAFFSASIGLVQNDLKKIIAYSTCSQLGYMIIISGFSFYDSSLFHLLNHGFFKALLFLGSGFIIHSINDEQDLRKIGNLKNFNIFSYISIFIGSISLMGLPFLTGYYSKDLLLELIYQNHYLYFSLWLGLGGAFITAFYSFRLIYYSFIVIPQFYFKLFKKQHKEDLKLILPLFILINFSIIIGYLLKNFILLDIPPIIIFNINKYYPFILSFFGLILSISFGFILIKWWKLKFIKLLNKIYNLLIKTWYFDNIINYFLIIFFFNISFNYSYKLLDNQIIEKLGPKFISKNLTNYVNFLSIYHLGKLSSYFFSFIFFILLFLFKI